MAKVKERGYSDKYLMKLWRDKVLHECLHSCVICGMSDQVSELECHHFVHRNHYLLRYDWRNGFPVCKYRNHEYDNGKGMSCHRYADTPAGREVIESIIKKRGQWDYIKTIGFQKKADFLLGRGISELEFLKEIKHDLTGNQVED